MALFNKFIHKDDKTRTYDSIQDIVENINNILNSKKDYGSYLMDYGIRDLNEFNNRSGMIKIIIEEVFRCIEKYEPRVRILNVANEKETNIFELSFRIDCVINDSNETLTMVFDTVFNNILIAND